VDRRRATCRKYLELPINSKLGRFRDRRWAVTWPSAGRFLTAYGQHAMTADNQGPSLAGAADASRSAGGFERIDARVAVRSPEPVPSVSSSEVLEQVELERKHPEGAARRLWPTPGLRSQVSLPWLTVGGLMLTSAREPRPHHA
jgi:hypothetical protein